MFDFEKLVVYKKSKEFNYSVKQFLQKQNLDSTTKDQLRRASFSIMLNIAEGSGRFTKKDKRRFYIISRGSAYECVAIFDYLYDIKQIKAETYASYYSSLEEISKMLYGMIRSLE